MSNNVMGVGILGLGSCLPEKVLTNADLEKMVETSDEWITKRTGISERRILEKDTPAYVLGIEAAKKAIEDSGICAEDIDLIIATTCSPDYLTPSTSCLIQKGIGASKASAFDLNAACSGFIYGITIAQQFIKTGYYKYVLVVSCEGMSKLTDWKDRNTCVLFGDAAGAAVLGPTEEGYGILSTHIGADGNLGEVITIPCCSINEKDLLVRVNDEKRVIWMNGGEVLKFAVRVMVHATERVLTDANLTVEDVKMIIPHQANMRIIDGAAKRLGIPNEKVFANIHKYGNTSSATVPVALEEALKANAFSKGDYIVLVGFGGGLTWASALLKWNK